MPAINRLREKWVMLTGGHATTRKEHHQQEAQPHSVAGDDDDDDDDEHQVVISSLAHQLQTLETTERPYGISDDLWAATVLFQPVVTAGPFNIILHLEAEEGSVNRCLPSGTVWAVRAYLTRLIRHSGENGDGDGDGNLDNGKIVRSRLSKKVQACAKSLATTTTSDAWSCSPQDQGQGRHYYVVFHFHADEGLWEFTAPDIAGDKVLIDVTSEETVCRPRRADIVVDLLRSGDFDHDFVRRDVREKHFLCRLPTIVEQYESDDDY